MNTNKRTVCLLGHSFQTRLTRYMRNSAGNDNLRLATSDFHVYVRARPGLTLSRLSSIRSLNTFRTAPDICFLHIGENELASGNITPERLVTDLVSFAEYLRDGVGVKIVVIGQLLRRQPWKAVDGYNEGVKTLNSLMEERLANANNIHFWKHRGFWGSLDFLARDGVHLKDTVTDHKYMNKYLQSIKSAILHFSRN